MLQDTQKNREAALQGCPWLTRFAPDAIGYLAANGRLIALADGTPLAARRVALENVAFVITGALRSTVISSDGYEYTVSYLGPGSFLGAVTLVDNEPNPLDVLAHGDSEILIVRQSLFRKALKQYPSLYVMISQIMAYRLRKSYAQIQALALDPIETRLKRVLIPLAEKSDLSGGVARIRITQDELGQLVKSTRATVNRIIKKLESQGLLTARYGILEVPSIARLRDASDDEPIYSE